PRSFCFLSCHSATRSLPSFPPTTLFRSLGRARGGAGAARSAPPSRLCRPGAAGPPPQRAVELGHHQAARPGEVDLLLPVRHARRDRKSTRLNSSHQIISYAVFCLKQKTA